MPSDDEDTPRIGLPTGGGRKEAPAIGGELFGLEQSQSSRWQTERSYEFATPEAALLFAACVLAVSMAQGVWPAVELCRVWVRVHLDSEHGPSTQERAAWREVLGWAQKLGAQELPAEGVT